MSFIASELVRFSHKLEGFDANYSAWEAERTVSYTNLKAGTKQLEEALNDYGFDYKKFTESIRFMHPTLQQNLFRLIKETIIWMADEKNRYIDLRNRASWEGSKAVAEIMSKQPVPFI